MEGSNKRVALIYNKLWHYRLPVFEGLSNLVNLTIYSLEESHVRSSMEVKKVHWIGLGRFKILWLCISRLSRNNDVVILYPDMAWLNVFFILLTNRLFRRKNIVIWTPGVSASYSKRFDEINTWDPLRNFLYSQADSIIVYSNYARRKLRESRFNIENVFVANNTVKVERDIAKTDRSIILFIGTIYKEKRLDILLDIYEKVGVDHDLPEFHVVGDGPYLEFLKMKCNNLILKDKVVFHGRVLDSRRKAYLFNRALFCVGPDQAGLAVLECFGNGVPFVCTSNALTGGERTNILNGYNGVMVDSIYDFSFVFENWKKYNWEALGENAREYYAKYANIDLMIKHIYNAIES